MLVIPKPKAAFEFQLEGAERIYSIPFPKDLPVDYTQRLSDLANNDPAQVMGLFKEIMERYAPGAWENLTTAGLELVIDAWKKDLGEQ